MRRKFHLIAAFLFIYLSGYSQQDQLIDSLLSSLSVAAEDTLKVSTLNKLANAYLRTDQNFEATKMANEAIDLSTKLHFKYGEAVATQLLGKEKWYASDYTKALNYYHRASDLFEQLGNRRGKAKVTSSIGLIYFEMGDYTKSLEYDLIALKLWEELEERKETAGPLHNIGMVYDEMNEDSLARVYYQSAKEINIEFNNKSWLVRNLEAIGNGYNGGNTYAEAIKYYEDALVLAKEIDDKLMVASLIGNIGVAYGSLDRYPEALENFFTSLKLYEEIDNRPAIPSIYNNIGLIYFKQGKLTEAKDYQTEALNLAKELGILYWTKMAYQSLYEIEAKMKNFESAFEFHKMYMQISDSIINTEKNKKLTQLSMQYDFDKKEASAKTEQEIKDAIAVKELQKQKLVRNGFIGGFGLVAIFAGVFFSQRNRIKKGKRRSDELLLNILPGEVAEELKLKGSADAQLIEHVTVLFTDFKGFTSMSEKLSPKELVADLHECFSAFDRITEMYRLEKIKTIGDAYMAAGGLPTPNNTHASDAIKAAMEMRDFIEEGKQRKIALGLPYFEIRIGIHTGPVVAGIVGVKKFQYDIWGDTVNTASRMESSGEVGQVNISETTYALVKDEFVCSSRGKVQAKGKGEMEMYFVG